MVYFEMFFDFLRYCVGASADIPKSLEGADWHELYAIAKKQALVGVLFYGIQKLPKELAPEMGLLMQWMGMAQRIKRQNARLFADSALVCKKFQQVGFRNCVLKGQGHALLYPDPYMRTPGDIDIYLEGGRNRIMEYVDKVCPNQVMRYHHVDFPVMKTPIEVHFTPSYMFCPWHNRRMQKWFGKVMDLQCSNVVALPDGLGEITVPTNSFNVIYILSHLYRHVFTEGIGLRQLLDYYFVVNDFGKVKESFSNHPVPLSKEGSTFSPSPSSSGSGDVAGSAIAPPEFLSDSGACALKGCLEVPTQQSCDCLSAGALRRDLKHLGLFKFAGAVMYVLHEVFGLSEDKMIAPIDEQEGIFLLNEIMRGGNFGQYDDRLGDKVGEGKVHRYFRMSLRNMRFVKHYPSEAICEPLFRTWFWGWKKFYCTRFAFHFALK